MKKQSKSLLYVGLLLLFFAFVIIVEHFFPHHIIISVLKKSAVYALVVVSMNLLNGFTGLFSLGQAGFMLLGAYAYAILTIPTSARTAVYKYFDGGIINFSLPELFGGGMIGTTIGMILAIVIGGLLAALFAYLIGLPVLRLKSDYLAIATLGFAEIIRAVFQWNTLGPLTNGSNMLKSYPVFAHTATYFLVVGICIAIIVLLINSTYGRAFKAIRDDEVAAEAMGINLARHKMLSFVISSFFAGCGGALLAMYQGTIQANQFKAAMTYELLLIVVIGGIGSITGSVLGSFLFVFSSEWWLRGLDSGVFLGIHAPAIFRGGFRLLVFSVIIMIFVLFFRRGIMGDHELSDLFRRKKKKEVLK
ncbi:MAG: branched-chain amino acid ABC transporter permease [Evtepia sp.]